jgi:uncharacterized protein YjbI with pentapeptide repeats
MTPPTAPQDRLTEIKAIHRDYRNFYQLLRGVVLVAVLAGIGVLIFSSDLPSYWQNIYVTVVGAIGTVLIIDQRAEQRAIRQRKEELIQQLGSDVDGFAAEAARLLRQKGWLKDGSLAGVDLEYAKLCDAVLRDAHLETAKLTGANLDDASCGGINLHRAELWFASLRGTDFIEADLRQAEICHVNMQSACLRHANAEAALLFGSNMRYVDAHQANFQNAELMETVLYGADFSGANLTNVHFYRAKFYSRNADNTELEPPAKFDVNTIMPDGTHWTPEVDLDRFTDPKHPQYFESTVPLHPIFPYPLSSEPS